MAKNLWLWPMAAWLLMASGCSTFNYEWRQAAKRPLPPQGVEGRWEGYWRSHSNGHYDKMRALITPAGTNRYDVRFHAAYKKGLTVYFGYTVSMEATPSTEGMSFRGQEDLGVLAGGLYTYEGRANHTNFFSTYDSKYDRGVFQMWRPVE